MKKIVRIGTVPTFNNRRVSVFCKVETSTDKGSLGKERLSISGVVGPMHNGDSHGSCGQIDNTLREHLSKNEITFAEGWDADKLLRFLDIWDEWHLNDLKPYDSAMKAAGWNKKALIEMRGYKFSLKLETILRRNKIKEHIDASVRNTGAVSLSEEEQAIYNLPHEVVLWTYATDPEPAPPNDKYERAKYTYGLHKGDVEYPETKRLGWLYPTEHLDGLLGRKLRPDGPGYGSAHCFHPLPPEVIDFLKALPDADKTPAWV